MEQLRPHLVRIAATWCMRADDIDDLVQDTLERALRRGMPDDVRSPCAYLVTIMKNLARDRRRAHRRRARYEPLDDVPAPAVEPEPPWAALELADVHAALAGLPPHYREVFVLHELEHRSYDELAARLAIQPITVGTRLTRARKRLRAALQKRSESVPA